MTLSLSVAVVFSFHGCLSHRSILLATAQASSIRSALRDGLPGAGRADIRAIQRRRLEHPTVIITAHLEGGRPVEDIDPSIPEGHDSWEALLDLAEFRAYRILSTVLAEGDTADLSELVVELCHGVAVDAPRSSDDGRTQAEWKSTRQLVYTVAIDIERRPSSEWRKLSQREFSRSWTVELNRIPLLEFRRTPGTKSR